MISTHELVGLHELSSLGDEPDLSIERQENFGEILFRGAHGFKIVDKKTIEKTPSDDDVENGKEKWKKTLGVKPFQSKTFASEAFVKGCGNILKALGFKDETT